MIPGASFGYNSLCSFSIRSVIFKALRYKP
jgi:hypothetical protein